jgi:hypothetical protein
MEHLTTKENIRELASIIRTSDTALVERHIKGHASEADVALERASAALLIGIRLLDLLGQENGQDI